MAFERPAGDRYVLLEAVTDDADMEIRKLRVDPATNELLVKGAGGGGGGDSNLIEIAGNPVLESVPGGLLVFTQQHERPVYSATARNILPAAAATDIATLSGSASKIVRVHNVIITATAGTGSQQTFVLLKRSAANTGGTSTTPAPIPWDASNDAVTAVVTQYTANPAALGALVGEYASWRYVLPTAVANPLAIPDFLATNMGGGQSIVLEDEDQLLAVNLAGGTINNGNVCVIFVWSEEDS